MRPCILVFNFSLESADEKLEREEAARLALVDMPSSTSAKRLDGVAGAGIVAERMTRRKNRNFAREAAAGAYTRPLFSST